MKSFIKDHFKNSSKTLLSLLHYENDIIRISEEIIKCNKNKKKLLVVGNGGSCADAEHFTGELVCTFSNRNRKPFSAISLTTNNAALTAWSNDFNFNSFFERQVEANGQKGDILFLLSTGGGDKISKASINLISAAKMGKKKSLKIISLIGKKGGELKKISDMFIHVKNNNTAVIQEAHMSILHAICIYLDNNK
jgi:D-sedoheptulose 7-phosphate isomerase